MGGGNYYGGGGWGGAVVLQTAFLPVVWNSEGTQEALRGGGSFHCPGICSGFQNQYEVGKKRNFQKVGMVGRHKGTGMVQSTQCGAGEASRTVLLRDSEAGLPCVQTGVVTDSSQGY